MLNIKHRSCGFTGDLLYKNSDFDSKHLQVPNKVNTVSSHKDKRSKLMFHKQFFNCTFNNYSTESFLIKHIFKKKENNYKTIKIHIKYTPSVGKYCY